MFYELLPRDCEDGCSWKPQGRFRNADLGLRIDILIGQFMTRERRKYPRVEIRWPLTLMTSEGAKEGETKNIGAGGALISCQYPLPLHEKICVILKIPNRDPVVVNTMVVRSNISWKYKQRTLPDLALYFLELTKDELQLLYAEISRQA